MEVFAHFEFNIMGKWVCWKQSIRLSRTEIQIEIKMRDWQQKKGNPMETY